MENNIKIFQYENQAIEFDTTNNSVMVNATEMAKVFGKLPANFLNTENTQKFIQIMSSRYCLNNNDIVRTSTNEGTWMHRKLALKFAAWLSPEFENWIMDTIEDILFGEDKRQIEQLKRFADLDIEEEECRKELMTNENWLRYEEIKREKRRLRANRGKELNEQIKLFLS
jgi:Asp-tRNA(Asn)/Glu-tRNA(Gln) amidotransferase C subunit